MHVASHLPRLRCTLPCTQPPTRVARVDGRITLNHVAQAAAAVACAHWGRAARGVDKRSIAGYQSTRLLLACGWPLSGFPRTIPLVKGPHAWRPEPAPTAAPCSFTCVELAVQARDDAATEGVIEPKGVANGKYLRSHRSKNPCGWQQNIAQNLARAQAQIRLRFPARRWHHGSTALA